MLLAAIGGSAIGADDDWYPITAADGTQIKSQAAAKHSPAAAATKAVIKQIAAPKARPAKIAAASPAAIASPSPNKAEVARVAPFASSMSSSSATAPASSKESESAKATAPASAPSIYYDPEKPTAVASAPVEPAPEPAPATSEDAIAVGGSALDSSMTEADSRDALRRPTYATPSVPAIEEPGDDDVLDSPPETQEIPQAVPADEQVALAPAGERAPASIDMSNYATDDPSLPEGMGNLRDFVAESEETSPIGFEVRETRCKLKTGEELSGLLILKVEKNSAAAKAGLKPFRATEHHVLQALAIGATLAFPPAILAVPAIDYSEVGVSYDMIVGIDGVRVARFIDFEERMRDIRAGELVYFSVVRSGRRIQIPVAIPASASAAN